MSICRRILDEERGNPWICECPFCREARERSKGDERLLHCQRAGQGIPGESQNDLPEVMGEGDPGL
jgi:hypothetical protein